MKINLEELLDKARERPKEEGLPMLLYRGDSLCVPRCFCSGLLPKYARGFCGKNEKPCVNENGLIEKLRSLLDHHLSRGDNWWQRACKSLTNWDILLIAQHYGLDTRFLDWTSDVFIALYFATHKCKRESGRISYVAKSVKDWDSVINVLDFRKVGRNDKGGDGCLLKDFYVNSGDECSLFGLRGEMLKTLFYKPKMYLGPRTKNQSSVMCRQVFYPTDQQFGNGCKMVPLERNISFSGMVERVVIHREEYELIDRELKRILIDRNQLCKGDNLDSFIFPDYDETYKLEQELRILK